MLKPAAPDIAALKLAEERLRWLSAWTIHHANHVRESADGLKVGGHQASCASMTAIMAALYFHALGPNDRVAVKPHAGPVLHAIHYLLGSQSREALENFRGFEQILAATGCRQRRPPWLRLLGRRERRRHVVGSRCLERADDVVGVCRVDVGERALGAPWHPSATNEVQIFTGHIGRNVTITVDCSRTTAAATCARVCP